MMSLKKPSYSWWFDSHNSPRTSPWLQSTLSELDEKTKAMLKLIEEDADSFAQRAEMYYKKRPQLVCMVEDFYRAHRSLAERYDQLKLEAANMRPLGFPFSRKNSSQNLKHLTDKSSTAFSDSFDSEGSEVDDPDHEEAQVDRNMGKKVSSEDSSTRHSLADIYSQLKLESSTPIMKMPSGSSFSGKNSLRNFKHLSDISCVASSDSFDSEISEVDDPEQEETQVDEDVGVEVSSKDRSDNELMKLEEELERLKEENRIQKAQLVEKNEEKREAIRQLCMSMDMLKEENAWLKKCLKDSKKRSTFEFCKLKGMFSGKLFGGHPKCQSAIVAL